MRHKAWCGIGKVPYCFSRSSVEFQGHTGWKIYNFDPKLSIARLQFQITDGYEMMHKAWNGMYPVTCGGHLWQGRKKLTILTWIQHFQTVTPVWITDSYEMMHKAWRDMEEVSYYFSRSSVKFLGHTGKKDPDLSQIWHFWQGWGTCICSTQVLNFFYSFFTHTHEFQSNCTRTCTHTRGQVLGYFYGHWPEYWYSMGHWKYKDENHHTCETNSLTFDKGIVPNWFILLWFEYMMHWYVGCDCKFHNFFKFYFHWKVNWIMIKFMFIIVIRPSPFSHSTSG